MGRLKGIQACTCRLGWVGRSASVGVRSDGGGAHLASKARRQPAAGYWTCHAA